MLSRFNKNSINHHKYVLIGCPNVGKSTFFNKITWKISPVSNMDRYTTTINEGTLRGIKNIDIIDLPGLTTFASTGHDEEVTIDYLLDQYYDGAINIISALSIHRDLMLTVRLAEAGVLNNIVINMVDELSENYFNARKIELKFNVPVIEISAKKNQNLDAAITASTNKLNKRVLKLNYNKKVEAFLSDFEYVIPFKRLSKRFIGIEALLESEFAINIIKDEQAYDAFIKLKAKHKIHKSDVDNIVNVRNEFVNSLFPSQKSISHIEQGRKYYQKFKKIDQLFMNPWIAIPGFIILMCLIYFITFYQYAGGWIQDQFATNVLEMLQEKANAAISSSGTLTDTWLGGFVADGILGGVFTIIGFLPWIIILFVSISIIEQIGILSRLSIVFDNSLKKSGLSGRSLINLFTGVGCNIPGMLLSRNISNKKERIVSVMCGSLISCSARVVVYGFIADAIISNNWSWMLSFGITIISILIAIVVARFFSTTLFRNSSSLFLVQIPRWRGLDVMVLAKRTGMEVYNFLKRTLMIVSVLNLLIWFLMSTGPNKNFILDISEANQATAIQTSFLYYLSYPFKYLLYPIGLGFDHWWSVSLLSSFPAKEVAASTIETIFGGSDGFVMSLKATSHGYDIAVITSFLIMFTFYIPCMASVAVMKKEIGIKYTCISIFSVLAITYVMSLLGFNFVGAITSIVNNHTYSYIPLIFMIALIILTSIIMTIHKVRTNRQNNGYSESTIQFKQFKLIYLSLIVSMFICLIISTTLLML